MLSYNDQSDLLSLKDIWKKAMSDQEFYNEFLSFP